MGKYEDWKGVPREQVPWYPTIDLGQRTGCKTCFEFCSHHVYTWDVAADRLSVAKPLRCVVGRSSCSHQCEQKGISFPPLMVPAGIGK